MSALDIWLEAEQEESQGNLSKAIQGYRTGKQNPFKRAAIKADPNIEAKRRTITNAPLISIAPTTAPGDEDIVQRTASLSLLTSLPEELCVLCFLTLLKMDLAEILTLSLVSKQIYGLIHTPTIYKHLAHYIHMGLVVDLTPAIHNLGFLSQHVVANETPTAAHGITHDLTDTTHHSIDHQLRLDDLRLNQHASNHCSLHIHPTIDWKNVLINTPRVRFNGIYISTIRYYRTGYSDDWNQPMHEVAYYRYLMLKRDGSLISYTTSKEPKSIVKQFALLNRPKPGMMTGRYSYHGNILTLDMQDMTRPKMKFHCSLAVENTRRKLHWSLNWINYIVTAASGTESVIPSQGLVQFYFSRVKSLAKA